MKTRKGGRTLLRQRVRYTSAWKLFKKDKNAGMRMQHKVHRHSCTNIYCA